MKPLSISMTNSLMITKVPTQDGIQYCARYSDPGSSFSIETSGASRIEAVNRLADALYERLAAEGTTPKKG